MCGMDDRATVACGDAVITLFGVQLKRVFGTFASSLMSNPIYLLATLFFLHSKVKARHCHLLHSMVELGPTALGVF